MTVKPSRAKRPSPKTGRIALSARKQAGSACFGEVCLFSGALQT
jgi:hypothetical protein